MNTDKNGRPERSQPESLRLQLIAPSLTVGDLEKSMGWYCDVLGFTISEKWEHDGQVMGADLVAGSAHLMIGQDDWAKGRDRSKGEGMRLYLSIDGDIDAFASGIESRGAKLDTQPEDMPWGARMFSLTDPDGFKLTFSAPI